MREKAELNKTYKIKNDKIICVLGTECNSCIVSKLKHKCTNMPLCETDSGSFIFKEVKE